MQYLYLLDHCFLEQFCCDNPFSSPFLYPHNSANSSFVSSNASAIFIKVSMRGFLTFLFKTSVNPPELIPVILHSLYRLILFFNH